VAIIMDGNGRWAKKRGLPRSTGHKVATEKLEDLIKYIYNKGIKVLSIYAFSTENFNRPKEEVDFLMNTFKTYFKRLIKESKDYDYKVVFSKKKEGLPKDLEVVIEELQEVTKEKTGAILNLCVNYSGQDEIVDVVKNIAMEVKENNINIEDITRETIEKNLYQDLPPIDLLIRTSGEIRISNFMLYQLAYSEMIFIKTEFPDFDNKKFDEAIEEYTKRSRRFGSIKE